MLDLLDLQDLIINKEPASKVPFLGITEAGSGLGRVNLLLEDV